MGDGSTGIDACLYSTGRLMQLSAACALMLAAGAAFGASDTTEEKSSGAAESKLNSIEMIASGRGLHLCHGYVDTDGACPSLATVIADHAETSRVIQLDGPLTKERALALEEAGIELGQYLPVNAFLADLSAADAEKVAEIDFIRWNSTFEAEWKIDPEIGNRPVSSPERTALADRGLVAVDIALFPKADMRETLDIIGKIAGVEVISKGSIGDAETIRITIPGASVAEIAALDSVQAISETPELTFRNSSDRWIVQSNVLNFTPVYDNGLHGEDQIVGVMDGRVNVNHCAFFDPMNWTVEDGHLFGPNHRKVVAYNTTQGSDKHGTHVAGTLVGDSGAFNDIRGIAYEGKMAFNSTPTFSEANLISRLDLHRDQGAFIHTNSWGADFRTDYNVWTRGIDSFARNNEDHLIVFAITNQSILYTPENAKNCLAVGASQDAPLQDMHGRGGIGPTADGRRKPEVYAPGVNTISASHQTSCGTTTFTGTSMAAPAVAGSAMLIRQYFTEGHYPTGAPVVEDEFVPTGALLKAMLINSAVDMNGIAGYPSDLEGWGRILIDDALYFKNEGLARGEDTRRLMVEDHRHAGAGALSTGVISETSFFNTGSSEQLRVTLVWTDAPAALSSSFTPVNNVDLEVISPIGRVYRGNVFSLGQSIADEVYNGGSDFDPLNNTEQVHVTDPSFGPWQVRVIGAGINQDTQGYALVITGAVQSQSSTCRSDLNGDGVVAATDLSLLLSLWGQDAPLADIHTDGVVNLRDLSDMLGAWGTCN